VSLPVERSVTRVIRGSLGQHKHILETGAQSAFLHGSRLWSTPTQTLTTLCATSVATALWYRLKSKYNIAVTVAMMATQSDLSTSESKLSSPEVVRLLNVLFLLSTHLQQMSLFHLPQRRFTTCQHARKFSAEVTTQWNQLETVVVNLGMDQTCHGYS